MEVNNSILNLKKTRCNKIAETLTRLCYEFKISFWMFEYCMINTSYFSFLFRYKLFLRSYKCFQNIKKLLSSLKLADFSKKNDNDKRHLYFMSQRIRFHITEIPATFAASRSKQATLGVFLGRKDTCRWTSIFQFFKINLLFLIAINISNMLPHL